MSSDDMSTEDANVTRLVDSLQQHWGMGSPQLTPLEGGMNSRTWLVEDNGSRFVAKAVSPGAVTDLVAGADVAVALSEAGFVTGRPIPTHDGQMVLVEEGLVLLEHVSGRELDGETDEEQAWIAATLAGVHAASNPGDGPSPAVFGLDWLPTGTPGVQAYPWLSVAIESSRHETDPLTLTWTVLHTDPHPGAFIHDDTTGVTGIIDWAGARRGPVLYDVASVVMYLGGTAHATTFLDEYQTYAVIGPEEMRHLDAFRRFREVVQGAYFAERLATDNLTGDIDPTENHKGLDDARRRLANLMFGVPSPESA